METTQTSQSLQDFVKGTDKQNSDYKIEEIGKTIFKRAENENEIIYLMGINSIAKIDKSDPGWWIDKIKTEYKLKSIDTKLMIPIIACMIDTMKIVKEKNK